MFLKSPFEKGGFRGIYKGLPNSPQPPFSKGGSFKEFTDEKYLSAIQINM
jgi:hypothetical protein